MWVVIKYKKNEFSFLKNGLKKTLGELPIIFRPKIKYQKFIRNKFHFIENDILGDYIICYHEKFKNSKILSLLTNLKGLKYFLKDSISNQKEIINFINYCKTNQGSDGYIHQSFFNFSNMSKGIFMSGPFTNMFFKVIENQGNKIKILIGNMTTTITKNSNYLYRPV